MSTRPGILVSDWLSAREAKEILFYFIRWGEHEQNHIRNLFDFDVEQILKKEGYLFDETIHELQKNPHRTIPVFENILNNGTWIVDTTGNATATVELIMGGVSFGKTHVSESGLVQIDYLVKFIAACKARNSAIQNGDIADVHSMLIHGIASIESFLNTRAHIYDNDKPIERQLVANGKFTTTVEKIKKWIPRMSGNSIDVGTWPAWNHFIELQEIRNNQAIHPKVGNQMDNLDSACDAINKFRTGIAQVIFVLHTVFGLQVQSSIIRAMLFPAVRSGRVPFPRPNVF